jgi:hypothetical protein
MASPEIAPITSLHLDANPLRMNLLVPRQHLDEPLDALLAFSPLCRESERIAYRFWPSRSRRIASLIVPVNAAWRSPGTVMRLGES